MVFAEVRAGLRPEFPTPAEAVEQVPVETEEAAVRPPDGAATAVTALVAEGDRVERGAAVACLRDAPDVSLVAPIAGQVARVTLLPGHKLAEIVLFREPDGGVELHDTTDADTSGGLRHLLQAAGAWPWLRRRPFGGMPGPRETAAAIFVMGADTRPLAPDPRQEIEGREEAFARGLAALGLLSDEPVFVCWPGEPPAIPAGKARWLRCSPRHPQGSAGIRIHQAFPAGLDAPVWDIHAGDVANLGALLATGELPLLRQVRIAGWGLREGRILCTHPGADLRQLTHRIAAPGPHELMSGSPLDGEPARWLGPRHRQVTVLPREVSRPRPHWLVSALTETAAPAPMIPTAALDQALGGAVPAAAFIRALGSGDEEAAMSLGLLSLLEEDLALADYTLGAGGAILGQLRVLLSRIRAEQGP